LPLIAPTVTKITETSSVESRKDRKRKEAQNRIALSKRQAPIKAEITAIEKQMERHELRLREIQNLMADPANYEKKDLILPLVQESAGLSQEVKRLEARWEELQTQLEETENRVLSN
jgi:ATP-binding cassette subfamily F protein 3